MGRCKGGDPAIESTISLGRQLGRLCRREWPESTEKINVRHNNVKLAQVVGGNEAGTHIIRYPNPDIKDGDRVVQRQ